jgi:hypothetical protein
MNLAIVALPSGLGGLDPGSAGATGASSWYFRPKVKAMSRISPCRLFRAPWPFTTFLCSELRAVRNDTSVIRKNGVPAGMVTANPGVTGMAPRVHG